VLGICHRNGYEGECASLLEQAAWRAIEQGIAPKRMKYDVHKFGDMIVVGHRDVFAQLDEHSFESCALGFHLAIAEMIVAVCCRIRERENVNCAALSGGVFQNRLLLEKSMEMLRDNGFEVYINQKVPPNDGGIALGQAYLACLAMKG